jgi:Ca2+-binding EF-hand superfamily protein
MMRLSLFVAAALAALVPLLTLAYDEPAPAKGEAQPIGAVQDIVYFAGTRPILIRLHIEVDGKAFDDAWDDYIAALFKYLDRDGDGALSPTEVARVPKAQELLQLLRGNLFGAVNGQAVANQNATESDKPSFDTDDGKITVDSLARYYRKNGAGPVQVTNYPPQTVPAEALTDVLFELLDTNKDGKLSKDELDAAEKKLMRLDADQDDLVSTQELVPTFAAEYGQQPNQEQVIQDPNEKKPPPPESKFFVVVPDGSPRYLGPRMQLARKLLALYDKDGDGKLSRNEVSFLGEFDLLDRNKDGFLDRTDLMRFIALDGDVELGLRIGKNEANKPLAQLVAPHGKPARMARRISTSLDGNAKFVDGGSEIDIRGVEGSAPNLQAARQTFLDSFQLLDKDRTGFVTRKQVEDPQFALLRSIFAFADRNEDGKLSEQELRDYLDLQSKAANAFIRVSIADNGSGLFGLLDANHDGQLGIRELRTAYERLKKYDENFDKCISRKELPHQFRVLVSRGEPVVNGPLLGAFSPTAVGPLWFRLMDRNGDGDVSPREFLGTAEDFKRLDLDGDGLISLEEAIKADDSLRKR